MSNAEELKKTLDAIKAEQIRAHEKMFDKLESLLTAQITTATEVKAVKNEAIKTNGKIAKNIMDIQNLKTHQAVHDEQIAVLQSTHTSASTKWWDVTKMFIVAGVVAFLTAIGVKGI